MKLLNFQKSVMIEESEKEPFERELLWTNLNRGKTMAILVLGIESILLLASVVTAQMQLDNRFHYYEYATMYLLFIIANLVFLFLLKKWKLPGRIQNMPLPGILRLQYCLLMYITFVMCWGSIIALMDQKLYGNIAAFMISMSASSVLFYLDKKKLAIPYAASVLLLVAGLPFFQSSGDVLVGHYVNLCVFVLISWIASRCVYQGYCSDYKSKSLLKQLNLLLEKEVEKKKIINWELSAANLQLRELSRLDELTRLPNRRSFRDFIENSSALITREDTMVSVMVIDIDLFKHYNDFYGHEEGDRTLIAVAQQIRSSVSGENEFVCRWGGEEFIYIGYHEAGSEAEGKAEVIRQNVSALNISHMNSAVSSNITVSIGICTLNATGRRDDIFEGIRKADRALYQAKNSGRNCVRCFCAGEPEEAQIRT